MANALFINGIYESVLAEILEAQEARDGGGSFLQPHKGQVIAMLREGAPSAQRPVRLYASTTANLSNICYTAEIVGWEDKRELSPRRKGEILRHLREWQPVEVELFKGVQEGAAQAVNVISIRNLRKLDALFPTSLLIKQSDGLPLQRRTRPGGWSEVGDLGESLALPVETSEQRESTLAAEVAAALALPAAARARRLAVAAKVPERVQIVSVGFRRNADVIATVLLRANGVCERCQARAPFLRRADGTPYLEVHHVILLSQGGEDTVENAVALCPNCHREAHHG